MDTNQNTHINVFSGGMNTDTSYDNIKNQQYTMAINARISTTEYNVRDVDRTYSNQKENILAPVYVGKGTYHITADPVNLAEQNKYLSINENYIYKILTSNDTNIILYKNYIDKNTPILIVGRIDSGVHELDKYIKILFYIKLPIDLDNVSAVLNAEQEDVINLYIATGETNILQINIADEDYIKSIRLEDSLQINIDDIAQNSFFPFDKLIIQDKISGSLKTQQVQYTYRFYKKHGICSKLAPVTNKIQVINSSKNNTVGCAEDTVTNVGFRLGINVDVIKKAAILFDRLQLYRISYVKANQNAEVNLIFDGKFDASFTYDDIKDESIAQLSMEEFSSISGLSIKPKIIENNQQYLFCGDIKDETIIEVIDSSIISGYQTTRYYYNAVPGMQISERPSGTNIDYDDINEDQPINNAFVKCFNEDGYLGGSGKYIKYRFVITPIPSCSVDSNLNISINTADIIPYTSFYIKKGEVSSPGDSFLSFETNGVNDIYLKQNRINIANIAGGYDNSTVSSMFRSLKRGEVYRYGIVFYDKYGNRTNVIYIGDIKTPMICDTFGDVKSGDNVKGTVSGILYKPSNSNNIFSTSLGLEFTVDISPLREKYDIVGYEIVRCDKNITNTHNIYQCVLSKPVQQVLPDGTYSPYYPTGFISTQPMRITTYNNQIVNIAQSKDAKTQDLAFDSNGFYVKNVQSVAQLFQCFCPDYYIYNKDVINNIKNNNCKANTCCYLNGGSLLKINDLVSCENVLPLEQNEMADGDRYCLNKSFSALSGTYIYNTKSVGFEGDYPTPSSPVSQSNVSITINKSMFRLNKQQKIQTEFVIPLCDAYAKMNCLFNNTSTDCDIAGINLNINSIAGCKNASWSDGFSNYTKKDTKMQQAIKKYKTFTSNIQDYTYLNWVCNNKYDYPAGANHDAEKDYGFTGTGYVATLGEFHDPGEKSVNRRPFSRGAIGPGGPCFLMKIDNIGVDILNSFYKTQQSEPYADAYNAFGTLLCNITHQAKQFSGTTEQERQYDIYYGFGNYTYVGESNTTSKSIIFDGDTYIDVQEIYGQFKAYDFNDYRNSLQSAQIVYYIPMESRINWRFDYGCNRKNTGSKNLQLEPVEITGVTTQERPLRQYNSIYSDNNTSNNIFNAQSLDSSINVYNQRIFYSDLKTNGENIDGWQIFRSVNFIDCNSKFGPITDLYTYKDIMYVWQKNAIAKLSVNERSLISDKNSNIIQLGQGDVLQRVDYISTNYGMRQGDMCKIHTQSGLFWFDYYNNCIATLTENQAVDYTDLKSIKSIMNSYNDDIKPKMAFDQKHNELLFGTIKSPLSDVLDSNNALLVINTKYNMAIGLYYIKYSNILQYDKDCISIHQNNDDRSGVYESYVHNIVPSFLTPMYIQFVVNNNPTITKVFDNQQINTGRRTVNYEYSNGNSYFDQKELSIYTDLGEIEINDTAELNTTDREGNIKYSLPRFGNSEYGNRIRGKYMLESIKDNNPNIDSTISNIITKYRISYN